MARVPTNFLRTRVAATTLATITMSSFAGKRMVVFGCGYVGTAVAREALARGCAVTALTRNAASADALRTEGIETIVADLATDSWHARIPGGADFVLNCVSSGGGGVDGYRHSYLDGMASVVAWARAARGIGTLVYTSSTSVYAQGDGTVVDESVPTEVAESGERARLLIAAENLLRTAGPEVCVRRFVLRLAGIYGPGRHHFIEQVRAGEMSGSPETHLNLIHRDDIVAAIVACFGAGKNLESGVFNLADDQPARRSEIAGWLASRLDVPSPRFTGEAASGRRSVTPDRIISNAKAKAVLGWAPRYSTFREGCAKILSR